MRSQQLRNPRLRELQCEAGDGQHNETEREEEVLPALLEVHPENRARLGAMQADPLADEEQPVVQQHHRDGDDDEE